MFTYVRLYQESGLMKHQTVLNVNAQLNRSTTGYRDGRCHHPRSQSLALLWPVGDFDSVRYSITSGWPSPLLSLGWHNGNRQRRSIQQVLAHHTMLTDHAGQSCINMVLPRHWRLLVSTYAQAVTSCSLPAQVHDLLQPHTNVTHIMT